MNFPEFLKNSFICMRRKVTQQRSSVYHMYTTDNSTVYGFFGFYQEIQTAIDVINIFKTSSDLWFHSVLICVIRYYDYLFQMLLVKSPKWIDLFQMMSLCHQSKSTLHDALIYVLKNQTVSGITCHFLWNTDKFYHTSFFQCFWKFRKKWYWSVVSNFFNVANFKNGRNVCNF